MKATNSIGKKNTGQTKKRPQRGTPAGGSPLHLLAIQLAANSNLLIQTVQLFLQPVILFYAELFIFPQKIQEILNRYLDLPVAPPTDPLGRALGTLSEIKRLIEEAREAIANNDPQTAKEKISEASEKANDQGVFPAGSLPGLPQPPVPSQDLESIRSELRFMLQFVTLLAASDQGD